MRLQSLGNKQKQVQDVDRAYEPSIGVILVAGAMAGLNYTHFASLGDLLCADADRHPYTQ